MRRQALYLIPRALSASQLEGAHAVGNLAWASAFELWDGSGTRRALLPAADGLSDRLYAHLSSDDKPAQRTYGEELLQCFSAPRASVAGLELDRPRIMGVVNVTPDSFSDGGERFDSGRAVADGLAMIEAGADIIDIGGESTRPGAAPVPVEEELRRVLPVVKGLAAQGARVSIDTRWARVMAEAAAAGAAILNDVTALSGDPESLSVAAQSELPVVLMHMQGEPQTMQADPQYEQVSLDVFDYLTERIEACAAAGIPRDRLIVDPGVGFGKTLAHKLRLLNDLALLHGTGCAILLGVSRKSFITKIDGPCEAKERLPGSLAAMLYGIRQGVQIVRVHDVAETRQALAVWCCMDVSVLP